MSNVKHGEDVLTLGRTTEAVQTKGRSIGTLRKPDQVTH